MEARGTPTRASPQFPTPSDAANQHPAHEDHNSQTTQKYESIYKRAASGLFHVRSPEGSPGLNPRSNTGYACLLHLYHITDSQIGIQG